MERFLSDINNTPESFAVHNTAVEQSEGTEDEEENMEIYSKEEEKLQEEKDKYDSARFIEQSNVLIRSHLNTLIAKAIEAAVDAGALPDCAISYLQMVGVDASVPATEWFNLSQHSCSKERKKRGDFSSNVASKLFAFFSVRRKQMSITEIANVIKNYICMVQKDNNSADNVDPYIEKAVSTGPWINFYLKSDVANNLEQMNKNRGSNARAQTAQRYYNDQSEVKQRHRLEVTKLLLFHGVV